MKKRTKLLSLLMCLVMLVSMLPLTAYAAEEDIAPVTIDTAESVEDSTPVTVDAAASDTLQDADDDGYYDIGTADELYAFAELVNGGETSANAILTADIVVNEGTMTADSTDARTWTPIGNTSNKYTGIFDGNGKTISGLYFNDSSNSEKNKYVGLFGYVSGGEIKNVGVINSWINAYDFVGGVVGRADTNSKVTDCYNTGTVSGSMRVGGVMGQGTVTNCYNTGDVSGGSEVGGVVGFGNASNCYNTGDVSGSEYVGGVVAYNKAGTVTSCYYLDTCGAAGEGTAKTAEQFASGEVAYLLNGSTSEGELVWKQTLGTDAAPSFTGGTVYAVKNCKDEAVFSNTNEAIGHNWVNGTCTVCGTAQITYCGTNTTLGTALDLNFAFSLCDVDENAYAVITGSSAEKTQTIQRAEWTLSEDGNYYLISYKGLAAKEMCDTVSLVIYDGSGNAMKIYDKEGAEFTCSDSIQSYALRCIGSSDEAYTPVVKTLLLEMLDYGTEAQKQFIYNTNNPANGGTYNTYNGSGVSDEDCTPVGGKYMGTSLILENRIEMQMGFTGIAGIQSAAVSYTDHYGNAKSYSGEDVSIAEYEDANGNVVAYGVVIPHIVVADARQMITVTVTTTDGETIGVKDSIAGYVARHNSEGVYGAIMDFSDAALAYFKTQTN